MAALALAVALLTAGASPALPPAPVALYRVAWERPFVPLRTLEWKPTERGGVAVDRTTGLVVFGTRDGWLHAVRPDGTLAWELQGEGAFGPPTIEGDTVYVGTTGGRLRAVAIPTGKERWSYRVEEDLATRPAVARGAVYVASLQDAVHCVDATTGKWRWHHRREPKGEGFTIFGAAAATVGADAVYGAYSDGYVAALDPKNGAVRWEKRVAPANGHLDVDALIVDGTRMYAAAASGTVHALDARTGDVLWTAEAPGAAQLVLAGGLVVAVTTTTVQGLSPLDGGTIWKAPLGAGGPAGSPVVVGKWILVPAGQGGLRWIEAASGRTLRVFDPGTGVSGPPASGAGRVYVLSNGGALFALELS